MKKVTSVDGRCPVCGSEWGNCSHSDVTGNNGEFSYCICEICADAKKCLGQCNCGARHWMTPINSSEELTGECNLVSPMDDSCNGFRCDHRYIPDPLRGDEKSTDYYICVRCGQPA